MKPGRELDALIAEKVMGFDPNSTDSLRTLLYHSYPGGHFPCYSTNIACAWEVVEKMSPRDDKFEISKYKNGLYEATFRYFEAEWSEAETAPHAICLAALKAVGIDLPEAP